MKKIGKFLLLMAGMTFLLMFCDLDEEDTGSETLIGESGDPNETWAVYWYLCGSDLESEAGAATDDLYEMMEAELPENVQVVIQTGGSGYWYYDEIDPEQTERYVYEDGELQLVDSQPLANMGEAGTLADFLSFCKANYPADKTMALFWNHGGGSVTGAAFDENFEYDSLTLGEFHEAFASVYDLSEEDPPLEVVGFDACLMATIDTAAAFSDISRYMVASEEMEPGNGWYYTDWLQALGDDPGMNGARLGQHICDTFMEDCGWYGMEDEATLSVIDLGKTGPLLEAYENMGEEALERAKEDPSFFSELGRKAEKTENYGGNTRDQGYANMLDLGHLAGNCEELLPQSTQLVLDSLKDCVLYQVKGEYRDHASGLSCYYSYNGDWEELKAYERESCSSSFPELYDYGLSGEVPELKTEEEYPLYIDDEDYVVLEVDQETLDKLKSVSFKLAYFDEEEDIMILLGQDNDIDMDWEHGIFRDNFRGVWGAIDGYPVYMEICYEEEDYTAYSVPILLNGKEYNLRVIYDYEDEEFYILGARKGLDNNGMGDKNLVQLQPGDEITTIHYAAALSEDNNFTPVEMDTFQVTKDTSFGETDMGDGDFLMLFELTDVKNNHAYSEMIQLTVDGDYVDIEIMD